MVNESGVNENLIYNNSFEKINEAIKTQGINQGTVGKEDIGLEILCNEFMECNQDIRVHGDEQTPDDYGIKPIQGHYGPLVTDPAGNRFSKFSALSYRDIYNDGIFITYYHHDEPLSSPLVPEDYNIDGVDPDPVTGNTYIASNACPQKYDPYEIGNQGGSASTESLKSDFNTETNSVNNLTSTLDLSIDGGDTPEMVYDVESSTPPESMEIRSELLAESPYISDTVMSSAIEKEDVLNNTMIYEVMTSNPKTARSQELLNKLDERQNPMPGYLKNGIRNAAYAKSERDSLEGLMALHNRIRQDAFNRTISKYLCKTQNPVYFDSIYDMLNNYRLNEKYWDVMMRFGNSDSNYQSVLANIPIQHQLSSMQINEFDAVEDFIDLINSNTSSNLYLINDSLFVDDLSAFAQQTPFWINHRATNLLRAHDKSPYKEPYLYENIQKSKQNNIGYERKPESFDPIDFYPNPADDYLIIDYLSGSGVNECVLIISDLNGKQIRNVRLSKAPSSKTIDLQGLHPGVYLFTVFEYGELKKSEKVTIVR